MGRGGVGRDGHGASSNSLVMTVVEREERGEGGERGTGHLLTRLYMVIKEELWFRT